MEGLISFMAYPLNLIFALVWSGGMLWLWHYSRQSAFVRFLLSRRAVISSILLFLSTALLIGLSGKPELTRTLWFALICLYLMTVLAMVLIRGWRNRAERGLKSLRLRFILLHAGLLLALSSGFWGTPDSESLRAQLFLSRPVSEAYTEEGRRIYLPYELELFDFQISRAVLGVDGKEVVLRVNDPHSISLGEDLYMSGYDSYKGNGSEYCIVEIVREPWKYWALAGILMMLAGAFLLFFSGPVAGARK